MATAKRGRTRRPSGSHKSRTTGETVPVEDNEAPEKLQKVLAQQGLASRRELEEWIKRGRIQVNGEPAHVGQRVGRADRIEVDGKHIALRAQHPTQMLILNKSAGIVCTRKDEEGRTTIFEGLPSLPHGRWISIGRLDIQTSGLLLLTNDGSLAHRMMHPSTGLDREYAVRINARLSDEDMAMVMKGVVLEGELLKFADIRFFNGSGTNHCYHVGIMEGHNREVRRLFEHLGCTVSRLKRVRFGPVIMPSWLRSGQWASMQDEDVMGLAGLLGVKVLPAPENLKKAKRSRVAKTSCLIAYPKLEASAKR
jgi:23S rRNA pseudouridine2605 synthase